MLIPTNAMIAVTDGARFILYRNTGPAAAPRLERVDALEQVLPSSAELGDSAPGRSYQSMGGRRSSYETPDLHDMAEARFAAEIAARISDLVEGGEPVLLIAAPRTLGHMRKVMPAAVRKRLLGELDADYTKNTPADLAEILARHMPG